MYFLPSSVFIKNFTLSASLKILSVWISQHKFEGIPNIRFLLNCTIISRKPITEIGDATRRHTFKLYNLSPTYGDSNCLWLEKSPISEKPPQTKPTKEQVVAKRNYQRVERKGRRTPLKEEKDPAEVAAVTIQKFERGRATRRPSWDLIDVDTAMACQNEWALPY